MLIPSKYYLEEGKEAPEGSVIKKCRFCNGSFAIPAAEASQYEKATVCDSDSCKEAFEKETQAAISALMKPPTDANDTIKHALGD